MPMTRGRALAVLLAAVTFLSWPCRRGIRAADLDVSIGFLDKTLTDDLFAELTLRFGTSPSFVAPAGDSDVYLELRSGDRLLADDSFSPPAPTSTWQPNKEYAWLRRVYIPTFIDEFSPSFKGSEVLSVTVGFTASATGGAALRSPVLTRKFRLVPAENLPVILYLDGWHPPESAPGNPSASWRWTGRAARCAIDNPGREALLVIRGETGPEAPQITLKLGDRVLDEFLPEATKFEKSYRLGKEQMGTGRDFILTIAVDRTFVPAKTIPGSTDERELGAKITLLYFR
jgi:hypothetical protein